MSLIEKQKRDFLCMGITYMENVVADKSMNEKKYTKKKNRELGKTYKR